MNFFQLYFKQNITEVWMSESLHTSGKSSFSINRLKDGAVAYMIHSISLSFANSNANIITVNGRELLTIAGATGAPTTHYIQHAIMAKSLAIACNEANTTITIHYQYLKDIGKLS